MQLNPSPVTADDQGMNTIRDRDRRHEDIWSVTETDSESEQAARRLKELLIKWSASGSLNNFRYTAKRPVSRSVRA